MLKDVQLKLEDTNMALFGTPLEHEIKKHAAETEAAWTGIGRAVELRIWRIEQFKVVAWPREDYGKFYDGDSYIILNTFLHHGKAGDKLVHDIHFWLGEFTTQDEAGTAAYKTVECDDFLDGVPIEHREVQDHESELFKSYFPNGIQILKGGVDTGFTHVETSRPDARLLHIKGNRTTISAKQVPCSASSLNSGDCFLLDDFNVVYLFVGAHAGVFEKNKGNQLCRAIDDERGGQVAVHVIGEFDMGKTDDDTNRFWELLGGRVDSVAPAVAGSDSEVRTDLSMHRISDDSGEVTVTEVPFGRASLDGNDIFIIDVGEQIFIWTGKASSEVERKSAFQLATVYLKQRGRPAWTPVARVMQGAENEILHSYIDK